MLKNRKSQDTARWVLVGRWGSSWRSLGICPACPSDSGHEASSSGGPSISRTSAEQLRIAKTAEEPQDLTLQPSSTEERHDILQQQLFSYPAFLRRLPEDQLAPEWMVAQWVSSYHLEIFGEFWRYLDKKIKYLITGDPNDKKSLEIYFNIFQWVSSYHWYHGSQETHQWSVFGSSCQPGSHPGTRCCAQLSWNQMKMIEDGSIWLNMAQWTEWCLQDTAHKPLMAPYLVHGVVFVERR